MKHRQQPRCRKPGGGRKPKHGKAMVQLQARVPPAVRAKLIDEFGSVQKAIDVLIIEPRLGGANG